MSEFFQDGPRLTNTFLADGVLRDALERLLPAPLLSELTPVWHDLGEAAAGPLLELAREAEANPPRHVPYDAWGRRIDQVEVAPAWKELHREAARWGVVAAGYEARWGEHARLHQFALNLLYGPSSAICTCPMAMTDGAARTLLAHDRELAARVVPRLTTRDAETFWTAGQWMTERAGGSDVSGTATEARPLPDGRFALRGDKWFTSAVTSEVALTLARVEGAEAGSRGLSLFYLELRRADGALDGIRVNRLKDKLGTRALPTAELTLEGVPAWPVGPLGGGVKKITPLLNTTRLHNAINACGMMARLLQLLRDWSRRRVAFGEPLRDKALHRETLAELHVEYEAALALTFDCARLLGAQDAGRASDVEKGALRFLTPLAKLSTGKQAVALASEALEGFGGAGYVEDTGLPVWLRDAQVLSIWEGTTNVLSLDLLRAAAREGALTSWAQLAHQRLSEHEGGSLGAEARGLRARVDALAAALGQAVEVGPLTTEAWARRMALHAATVAAAVPMLEQAAWGLARGRHRTAAALRRWLARPAAILPPLPDDRHLQDSALLSGVMD